MDEKSTIIRTHPNMQRRIIEIKSMLEIKLNKPVSMNQASKFFADHAMLPQDDIARVINIMGRRPFDPFGRGKRNV